MIAVNVDQLRRQRPGLKRRACLKCGKQIPRDPEHPVHGECRCGICKLCGGTLTTCTCVVCGTCGKQIDANGQTTSPEFCHGHDVDVQPADFNEDICDNRKARGTRRW